jgi:hypothetical protein
MLAVALVFVGFSSAEAHCHCSRSHKIHRVTPQSHPVMPQPQGHCCDRGESEVAELKKIEQQLTDILGAINDTGATLKAAIDANTTEVKNVTVAVAANTTEVKNVTTAVIANTVEVKNVAAGVNATIAEVKNVTVAVTENTAEVKNVTAAMGANTVEVKNVTAAVIANTAEVKNVTVAVSTLTGAVNQSSATLKDTIENTGKGITAAISLAGEKLKKEVQAARNVLDALYSRPNSFLVKVGNEAVPCPQATASGGCPVP